MNTAASKGDDGTTANHFVSIAVVGAAAAVGKPNLYIPIALMKAEKVTANRKQI